MFFSGADCCLVPWLLDVVLDCLELVGSFPESIVLLLLCDRVEVRENLLKFFNQNLPKQIKVSNYPKLEVSCFSLVLSTVKWILMRSVGFDTINFL